MTSAQQQDNQPQFNLDSLFADFDRRVNETQAYNGPIIPEPDEISIEGIIWKRISEKKNFPLYCNIDKALLTELVQESLPHWAAARKRGPKPKSTLGDMWCCYLIWAKSGATYAKLAKTLKMKETRFEDNINRIRTIINTTLRDRWNDPRLRPTPLHDGPYPHAALLIDSHTTETFRPKGRFGDAMNYFDAKNGIYGVKTEVAVSAAPPHYAIFVQSHHVGSAHDYANLKKDYHVYPPYLLKTPDEAALLPNDAANRYWATILDKGYVGPAQETPDMRRICPTKKPKTPQQVQTNDEISRVCVPVEQFFGRLTKSWAIVGHLYRWDHSNFDMDFENMCLFTNELIRDNQLAMLDYVFYRNLLNQRYATMQEHSLKRKATTDKAKEKKKAKLRNYGTIFD